MMRPIGCAKTSVANYQSTLHNIPEIQDKIFLLVLLDIWKMGPVAYRNIGKYQSTLRNIPEERRLYLVTYALFNDDISNSGFIASNYEIFSRKIINLKELGGKRSCHNLR